jgi:hypothetical protein
MQTASMEKQDRGLHGKGRCRIYRGWREGCRKYRIRKVNLGDLVVSLSNIAALSLSALAGSPVVACVRMTQNQGAVVMQSVRRGSQAVAMAIVLLGMMGTAWAGDWAGTVSSNWHDPNNWTGKSIPTTGSNWTITANTPYRLIINDSFLNGVRTGTVYARDGFTINSAGSMYVGNFQHVSNASFGTTYIYGLLDINAGGTTANFWRIGTWIIDGGTVKVYKRLEMGNTTSGTFNLTVKNGGLLQQTGGEYFITGNNSSTVTNINIDGANSQIISYDNGSTSYSTWINRYNTSGRVTITNGGSWNMHNKMADTSSSQRGLTYLLANSWVRDTDSDEELVLTANGNRFNVVATIRTWAGVPSPTTGATGYTYSPALSWVPGYGAQRSEVYFGTSQSAVTSAQKLKADINGDGRVNLCDVNDLVWQWLEAPVHPCPDLNYDKVVNFVDFATMAADYNNVCTPLYLGMTTGSTMDSPELSPNTTYYWRVDSADCNGVVKGNVWSFTTASAKAANPTPSNSGTGVTYAIDSVALSWAKGFSGSSYQVYFGTSSGSMSLLGTTTSNTMASPTTVKQNTQYYWRVDTTSASGTLTGDVWTFKTGVYAFPGAEGFGRWAKGGRGGTVYHVTNLNDSGTGSLRNASTMSNVTIVFDVGGYITISSKLGFTGKNVTIAGQTAPGGIGIKGAGTSIGADQIIVRHIRCRPGNSSSSSDALAINSDVDGCIVDHCSINFSTDENHSISQPLSTTSQWNINAWGLQSHSCGSLLYANNTTFHHTLWAHNHTRNPKSRYGLLDWVNNVDFDWDIPYICADADSDTHWANVVNSYFISAGGSTDVFTSAQSDRNTGLPTYHMYLSGTLTDLNHDYVLNGTDKGTSLNGNIDYKSTRYAAPQVTTDSPTLAYKRVLSMCGAMPWVRDEVDTLLMSDVKTETRRIINGESDLGLTNSGFGTLGGGTLPTDTDQDGMPDYWETAMGLSPSTANNNDDTDGDGYTNLETYLNWLGAPHMTVGAGGYADIDLRLFTSGFATSATYTIVGATGGTASILSDGHTARFTAGTSTGLYGFSYTVNDGSSFTDSVQVLVTPSSVPVPNPMTWSSAPAAVSAQAIAMTATTASSLNGVDYYFTCTAGGGHDSGWQSGTSYTDTGLLPSTTYTYAVQARDKGNYSNVTAASGEMSATTGALPVLPSAHAWWMFDETSGASVSDASGNGNTGTLVEFADPNSAWTAGKFGNCVSFTGSGYRTAPSSATIDFGDQDMSVSFWMNAPASITAETQQEILMKGTIGTTSSPGSGKRYEFYRSNSGGSDTFRFAIDDNVTKSQILVNSSVLCTGAWVHVVGVRDTAANQMRLYVDNVLVQSGADGTGSISQDEPMLISFPSAMAMTGYIDDVRVYGSALTADQIYAIYLGN